jgi:hypothetical protein
MFWLLLERQSGKHGHKLFMVIVMPVCPNLSDITLA